MKNNITLVYESFEKYSESQVHNLVGGFSKSFSSNSNSVFDQGTNNCRGGNCTSGCSSTANLCNSTQGCCAEQLYLK